MNTELIISTNIQNIDTAYGGVRGTTLSSRHNMRHWQTVVDSGNFYIACAMGLHRTDMALSIYWMFHGADRGLDPPILKGHTESGELVLNRLHNKVFRRLNSLYEYLSGNASICIPNRNTFIQRKNALVKFNS